MITKISIYYNTFIKTPTKKSQKYLNNVNFPINLLIQITNTTFKRKFIEPKIFLFIRHYLEKKRRERKNDLVSPSSIIPHYVAYPIRQFWPIFQ